MKKEVKNQITDTLKRISTDRLNKIRRTLCDWDYNHGLKINSWFWSNNGNANERSRKEKRYNKDEYLKIGAYIIRYWSNCSMSRVNVYWTDGLEMVERDDIKVSFGDIRYLCSTISEILSGREEKRKISAQ